MEILGISFVLFFYAAIALLGLWIGQVKNRESSSLENLLLAGRDLGLLVGIFTLVATEVGGAFINGTAEEVYSKGILWCLAPLAYSLSMALNGVFLLPEMRRRQYVTVVDSLQESYGMKMGVLIYIPSFIGDICWTAALLTALGSTLSVLLDTDQTLMILISAGVAVLYTLMGGMYSVAYTDVLQLLFVVFGLWISLPFILSSQDIDLSSLSFKDWSGSIGSSNFVTCIDTFIMLLCGGIPWQGYYQRALALRTTSQAQALSYISALTCITFMIPPILIGGAAKSSEKLKALIGGDSVKVLPLVIGELCPKIVNYAALGAVSAASMSSMDSAVLSGASYFSHNVYCSILRPQASRRETLIAFRLCLITLGALAAAIAVSASSIYGLWSIAGDLSFVVVFPQFATSLLCPNRVNAFGTAVSIALSLVLRVLIGESALGLPPLIPLWTHEGTSESVLPLKTIVMTISLCAHLLASRAYNYLYPYFGKMNNELMTS